MSFFINIVEDVIDTAIDLVEGAVDLVFDAVEFVVDEIVEPVVSTIGDVIEYALDNPIEAIAIAASFAVPGLSAWVVPLASGAQTLVNGGDLGDAIKSATLSYAGQYVGSVAKTYVAPSISSAVGKTVTNPKLASTVATALTKGVEAGAKTFVSSEGDLSAAAKSFATAGTLSGVSSGLEYISDRVGLDAATDSVMGNIQDKLEESGFDKSINDLSTGVKDAIYAGVAAELTGQNVSSAMLGAARDDIFSAVGNVDFIDNFINDSGFIQGVVDKFEPVAKFMDGFVDHVENTAKENLSDTQIKILTDSVTAAWDQAKLGNPDLAGEAFFDKMAEPAYDELYDMITDPVNEALDNLTGNAAKTEAVAETLNTALVNAKNGADGANSTAATIKARFDELDRRKSVYDTAVANQDASAANAAADAFNTYNDQLKKDLPALEEAYNNYVEQFNKWNPQIEGLQEDYEERSQYLVSDVEDLDAKLKPVFSGAERIAALAIRPQIDEDKYREATGIGEDESVWAHYLANQKEINTVFAQEAVDNFNRAKNDITSDTAPIISSEITRPNTYGPPPMPGMPEVGSLPNVDLTVPKRPGNRGDPRDYGLTKEEIDKYTEASVGKDAWYNIVSGAYEMAANTAGGFATFADEIAENLVNSYSVDYSEAEAIAYNNYAIMYDPNLTSAEKKQAIADNTAAQIAAYDKALAEEGANIDTFSGYTDPVKNYLMSASERAAGKISPEMQVRQYNALPAEDTTWEQILTGKAKDRLGRPYGLGDPLATVMSGVQELPDLLVDVALLAVTKNPAVLGGTVAVTSMAEAGEAAADEIESNLRTAYKSGALQATPEFADLVRLYKGDEDAALERLIDQGMGYAAVSGVIGGLGDVVLAKIAGASGASKLLSEVPTGLKPVVKIGTGGLSEGITESFEQVPVNMADINAGLDTSISTGTGVAFLQAVTSGGTATAGAASFEAVANTLRMAKDGLLSYTMPDGSTVSPEPPSGAYAATLDTTARNLAEYGVRVNLLNDLASWDAIPAQPTALTAQELTDTLNNLNIGDTAEVTNLVNTVYDNSVITLDEARTAFKQTPLTEIPSDSELDKYTGIREAAEFAAEVAAYVDPRFLDIDEVKAAAAAEGITLTDEQAAGYVGPKNEADAVADIAAEYDPQGTTRDEAEQFFADVGYTPTEEEIAARIGATPETEQKEDIAEYVDPRQVTEAEVRQAFKDQGYEPTDEEVAAYIGQGGTDFETNTRNNVGEYIDPRQVTDEEARQFFADLDYIPSDEEVAARVGQVAEAATKEAIDTYVDPRYTTEEEIRQFFEDQGFVPDDRIVERLVGQGGKNAEQMKEMLVAAYVDPRQVTDEEARQFFADQGYEPTNEEVAARVGQGEETFETDTQTGVEGYVDPRQVTDAEARKFFSDLGYTPTDEEVADFTAQVAESEQKTAIDTYVDPRFVTQDEVQAIADAEGLTLTEALAATYLGQKDQESTLAAATAEFDPLATTTSEAKAFFEAQGFTPTDQQVANFVASKTEEGQKAAIAEFVDPRQVTTDEAKALFDALGYNPTDAEVADFVGQGEADFATAAETGVATYVDPRMVDADEVSAAYADLGLSRPTDADIQALIGQYMETDLAGRAEENLPTARYNSIMNILDNFTGEVGVSDEMKEALETVKGDMIDALGDLGLEVAAIDQAVNDVKAAVDALPVGASPEDVSTAINDAISGLENLSSEDVNTAITTALEGMNNLSADDVQGIIDDTVAGLNNLSADDVQGIIDTALEGLPETASPEDVSTAINDAISGLENISAEDVDTAITTALEGMNNLSADDVQGIVDAATGTLEGAISELATDLTKLIEDNAGDVDTALAELAADLGTTEEALLAELDTTKEALSEQFTAGLTALEEDIGGVAAGVDDLAALVEDYEAAGVDRDTAISLALEQLSTELGQTETDILAELGLTEAELGERIDASTEQLSGELANAKADLLSLIEANEAAGLTRDEATQAAIGELASAFDVGRTELLTAIGETEASLTSQITDVETGLTETIGDVETSLGADIEAVADLIGKPARDVTQTDIDFVIDLIAQENVSQELITQYDVNADGTVDIADQTLLETALQGDQDVTLADTSMFTPATGLYLQQEQDTQTTMDAITDMNTQINTNIQTEAKNAAQRDFLQAAGMGAFDGRGVTVTTPDVMNIDYLYDISGDSIFATPQQAGLFASPYGGTRAPTQTAQPVQPTQPFAATPRKFAQGGQIEDETDMLLRILGGS